MSIKLAVAYTAIVVGVVTVTAIISTVFLVGSIQHTARRQALNYVTSLSDAISEAAIIDHQARLRAIAERSEEQVDHIYNELGAAAGAAAVAQAQSLAWEYLSSIPVGTAGYISVTDTRGVVLHHPEQVFVGTDISN
ncbi:MAG: hypothetical protein E4H09_01815, partial [Spirochaetales bacterium]